MTTDELREKMLPNLSKSALRSTMSRRGMKAQLVRGGAKQASEQSLGKNRGGFHLLKRRQCPAHNQDQAAFFLQSNICTRQQLDVSMTLYDFCQQLCVHGNYHAHQHYCMSATGAASMASPHLKTGSMKTNKSNENNESNESVEISALRSATKHYPCALQDRQQTVTPAATDESIQPTTTAPPPPPHCLRRQRCFSYIGFKTKSFNKTTTTGQSDSPE